MKKNKSAQALAKLSVKKRRLDPLFKEKMKAIGEKGRAVRYGKEEV